MLAAGDGGRVGGLSAGAGSSHRRNAGRYARPIADRLPDGVELSGEQAAIDGYGPLEPIARK